MSTALTAYEPPFQDYEIPIKTPHWYAKYHQQGKPLTAKPASTRRPSRKLSKITTRMHLRRKEIITLCLGRTTRGLDPVADYDAAGLSLVMANALVFCFSGKDSAGRQVTGCDHETFSMVCNKAGIKVDEDTKTEAINAIARGERKPGYLPIRGDTAGNLMEVTVAEVVEHKLRTFLPFDETPEQRKERQAQATRDRHERSRRKNQVRPRQAYLDSCARCRDAVLPKIQELAATGLGYRAIAKTLNAEGIPTASGEGKWDHKAVKRVLTPGVGQVRDAQVL